jgi:hypothetical protein
VSATNVKVGSKERGRLVEMVNAIADEIRLYIAQEMWAEEERAYAVLNRARAALIAYDKDHPNA